MANDRSVGSTSVKQDGGAGKKKAGWLPWALLAAGLLALAIFLLLRNSGDEGDDPGVDATDEASSSPDEGGDVGSSGGDTGEELADGGDGTSGDGEDGSTGGDDGDGEDGGSTATTGGSGSGGGTTATTGGSTGGSTGGGAGGSGGGQPGTITSEGTAILPAPAGGLATYSGKGAQARSVPVESVVADEGFWVGTSETDRVFVFFAADNAGSESRVQVEEGQTISFDGMVKPLPPDFATAFEVDAAEGVDQLEQQGQYIEIAPDAITLG
jgi:hypothetical protein